MLLRSLPLFLLCWIASPAAAAIYKCTDGKDHIAYQAKPCAAHLRSQVMALKAAAPPAADKSAAGSRENAAAPPRASAAGAVQRTPAHRRAPGKRGGTARGQPPADNAELSWECRIANGEVFYQHSPCPDRVTAVSQQRDSATHGRHAGTPAATAVSTRALPRREACRRIHAASASGRAGHERDEDVSSYERSLGRDPCR